MSVLNEKEADKIDVFKKNKSLHRPISPHLSIYRPQLTWLMSIASRFTGCGAALPLYAGAITYLMQPHSIDQIIASVNIPLPALYTAKFILAWPFVFHSLNGLRHLIWDTGRNLSLPAVIYGSLVASIFLTFLP
jgi:succinate dehydrogenase (ubiquinone) cytochrome b560 subunit